MSVALSAGPGADNSASRRLPVLVSPFHAYLQRCPPAPPCGHRARSFLECAENKTPAGRRDRAPLTERLRREPVVRLAAESRGRALLDDYLADERIRPVSTIDVPSVSLLLSYVSGGLGIGLVPALALAEAPPARVVSAPARVAVLPVSLVWRAAARRPPALARLAALLATAGARVGARLARTRRAPEVESPP